MNILLVSDVSIKKVIGGAERVLYEQSIRLTQRGHKVFIITRKNSDHSLDHEIIEGVSEYRYAIDASNPFSYLSSTIKNCQKLYYKISRDINFDVINFHQPFSAFAVNLLPETKNIKKIYTCHSLSFEEYISRQKKSASWINIQIRKYIEKFSLNKSSKIVVLSQFTKSKLINNYSIPENKINIISGGVDLIRFKPIADKISLRTNLNISQNHFVLFTARNLVPRMGLENLITTMSILKDKAKNINLIIAGDGPLKSSLQKLIIKHQLTDKVNLVGFLSREELIQYYQTANFFILPTVELEGFGLVTIEALACATPVLGTPNGGTLEILNKFDKSFLFKDTRPESMAELILEKYHFYKIHPDDYNQLTIKAKKFAEANYSWEININALEQILN